ncbi:N,N-dimethylformamidase beta subunit family domain-containing protein [Nonomuraea muscovyensis]
MTASAYAVATSCAQGSSLRFVVDREAPVVVSDATDDRVVFEGVATAPSWELDVPAGWPSSLYRARFGPEVPWPRSLPGGAPCPDNEVYFVVREAVPAAPVLVSVPFTTWQAYNRAGEPGQSVYWTESPARAARVSFDRPGGGPPPERWEEGLMRWLRPAGYDVAYCSNLDLDDGRALLSRYRMLIVNGHDEYWSAGMRDTVEEFVRGGGGAAFFAGNTCWWQIRLEDGGRTMVCHRDPLADPVADRRLTTVEWSAAGRPENTLTGVSFRAGAGTWGPHMPRMLEESYTVRFAGHWVFEGTGLADGDAFGRGCLGYETDAAEFDEDAGVPRVTSRDGTPSSFVVLATADLRHWSAYGQGGRATMGVFTSGLGTVFTAATVNWGNTLHDPVVERITRNVIDRLSSRVPSWDAIGPAADLRALAVLGRTLYAVTGPGGLVRRELCGQNLPWLPVPGPAGTPPPRPAGRVRALAVPREAAGGVGVGLYGVTSDGRLLCLDESFDESFDGTPRGGPGTTRANAGSGLANAETGRGTGPANAGTGRADGGADGEEGRAGGGAVWREVGPAPREAVGLAVADCAFHVATSRGELWRLPFGGAVWERAGACPDVAGLSGMNGRLFAPDAKGRLLTRLPTPGDGWAECGVTVPGPAFTAHAGLLIAAGPGEPLRWHPL